METKTISLTPRTPELTNGPEHFDYQHTEQRTY